LRERSFVLFLVSRLGSGIAVTLLQATVAWQVYAISGSAFHLGLIGLAQFAPALGLSLIAGAVSDSHDRRRVVMLAQAVAALCSAALYLATASGQASLPLIYALVVLIACAAAFENPAGSALLPQLVPRSIFQSAVTVTTAVRTFAFMSGPVAMGFIIDAAGVAVPYAVHVALLAGSLAALRLVRLRLPPSEPRGVSWAAVREGLAFVRRQPIVLGCMTLDMFAVLFGSAKAMLPIYASDILQVGPRGYGVLSSSLELGAVAMAAVMIAGPPIRHTGRALLLAVGAFGLATIVFGLSRWFPLSLAAYMVAGMADYVSVVMRGTAIQLSTPDHLRGRVSSVNMLFIGASNQLGAAESGFVAALTTPTFSVVSGGVGALLTLLLVAVRIPELLRYRAG
jgi:MFS family permease